MTQDQHAPRTDRTDRAPTGDAASRGHSDQPDPTGGPATTEGIDATADTTALSRPADARERRIGGLGILGLAATLWALTGPEALLLAAPIAALWYATSAPYAVAAAHVALVALAPSIPGVALVAFEASALTVLLGDVPATGDGVPIRVALATAAITVSLAAIAAGSRTVSGALWVAAGALVATFALCAYGVHRYAIVRRRLREGTYES